MLKAIHGNVFNYISNRIDMNFYIHGYVISEAGSMNAYLPTVHKKIYRNNFLCVGGKLWNDLLDFVRNPTIADTFK